ncbi:MAG: neutral/alkaline non-lysosomal ceramidase N-terminal domain-containing protein [Anaerolineae bacterium]|jgi:hypothetical protein
MVKETMTEANLLAGAAEVDITPPIGVPMEGYVAREGNSVGVHDPLLAQALLLRAGQDAILLFTLDFLGVGLDFTRRVREQVARAIDVRETDILLACTHTHSGPAGFLPRVSGLGAEQDPGLQEITIRKLAGAARWAESRLRPALVGVATGQITEIGRNRNNPESGPLDPSVVVLRVDDGDGEPVAVLMNYGCHPTVLGYKNRLLSADYPGAARSLLRDVYPETVFMFANGASGDVSTRFTRRDQTFREVLRMGRILGGEVLRLLQTIEPSTPTSLSSRVADIELPIRDLPSADAAAQVLEARQAELERMQQTGASHGDLRRATTKVEGARVQVRLVEALADRDHVATQVQVIRIGDLVYAGLPGEPFSRVVLDLKARSSAKATAVISYANDDVGYFPDDQSMAEGTYEAMASPYGLEGVQLVQSTALSLMRGGELNA